MGSADTVEVAEAMLGGVAVMETCVCDLTGIMVYKGNHPQMALIQVSELL